MPVQPLAMHIAVIGGGPAGLMAAEVAREAGVEVDLFDRMGSVGRKILIAGKGGLNLSHSEERSRFVQRFGARSPEVAAWIARFPPEALRDWAERLGVATMVGSSGRIFPRDLRAAPLLRGWVRRLREQGVRFHLRHRWLGWRADGALEFETAGGQTGCRADACILALGGGSWARLGSDGRWVGTLREAGVQVHDLLPANGGFETTWSPLFRERHAGQPLKPVALTWAVGADTRIRRQGELMIANYGIEGSLVYAASADLRRAILAAGAVEVMLDLVPGLDEQALASALAVPRGKRSFGEWLRRRAGLAGVRAALLRERTPDVAGLAARALAHRIKHLPLRLTGLRPLDEAISSAGGVAFTELDGALMLRHRPGVFCAGEMVDWEAPTGGYLLNAALASGVVAAEGALCFLEKGGTQPVSNEPGSRPRPPICRSSVR